MWKGHLNMLRLEEDARCEYYHMELSVGKEWQYLMANTTAPLQLDQQREESRNDSQSTRNT